MISQQQALEAEQTFKWCHDLEQSAAFEGIIVAELKAKEAEHLEAGMDLGKKPRVRAEHHRAYRLAANLLGLVAKRKKEATDTLQLWKEQHGERSIPMPDGNNL
jgi:hypothetical protein